MEEKEPFIYFNKRKVITRDENGIEVPYLIRRTILNISKFFSIKLHKIIQSDEICSHDHPWPFITIILKGGYYEWSPSHQNDSGEFIDKRISPDREFEICRWHGPGSILYRPASWRHQLELKPNFMGELIPATTLVFTGKVIRKWGFFTKSGWIFWENYDKQRDC